MKRISVIIMILLTFTNILRPDESSEFSYGMKLYNDEIYDVAVTQFRNFLERYPSSADAPRARFHLADSYLELDDLNNALKNFQGVVLDHPRSEYAENSLIRTAEIYLEMGDKEKAARFYLQIRNYFPSSTKIPETMYNAVKLFYEIKKFDPAEENIAVLKKNYPSSTFAKKALLILAEIKEDKGLIKQSDRIYYELLRSSDSNILNEVRYRYALFLLRRNNISKASELLSETVSGKGAGEDIYYPALIELSGILLKERKFSTLQKKLRDIEDIPDEYAYRIYILKGEANYFLEEYSKAFDNFQKAVEIHNTLEAQIKKAYTLSATGKFDEAGLTLYNSVLDDSVKAKDSKNIKIALLSSAENYFKTEKYNRGITSLKYYKDNFPGADDSDNISYKIGDSYYRSGKYSFAYDVLKNHPVEFPGSPLNDDAIFLAAESMLKMKEWKKALDLFIFIKNKYPASDFRPISEKRIDYLNTYRIRSSDLNAKIAELSSRAVIEEDKTVIIFDWARFYYYDLKDFVKANEYLNRYLDILKKKGEMPGTEARYILASTLSRLFKSDEDKIKNSVGIYTDIISDTTSKKIWKYRSFNDMLNIQDIDEFTDPAFFYTTLRELNFDDADGTLEYGYIKRLGDDDEKLTEYCDNFINSRSNSKFIRDIKFIKAQALRRSGSIEEAMSLYKDIVEHGSKDSYYLKSLQILSSVSDDDIETRVSYLKDLSSELYYTDAAEDAHKSTAELYFNSSAFNKALEIYLKLQRELDKETLSSVWNFNKQDHSKQIADIYMELSRYDKAEFYYRKALSRQSGNIDRQEILLSLSDIYKKQNNKTALEENFKELSKYSEGEYGYRAALSLADIELEKDNITKAINEYRDILTKYNPDDTVPVESRIIKAYYNRRSISEADNLLEKFRNDHKDNYDKKIYEPQFYLAKSNAFLSLDEYTKALKGYEALVDDYPDSKLVPKALYGQAVIMYNIGKKDKAFDLWTELVKKYPDDEISIETNYHLGAVYNNREEFDKAITAFQDIIKYPGDHRLKVNSYKHLIDLYLKLGFDDAAARIIREYISLYPDEEDIFQKRIEIGNIYQRHGEYNQALDYFKRLMYEAKGDDEAAVQFFIAETYMMMKDFRKAISEFLKVKYLIKTDSPLEWKLTAVYKSALCYEELKEYDKALEILNEISENHPNDSYGRQARTVIERIERKKAVKID